MKNSHGEAQRGFIQAEAAFAAMIERENPFISHVLEEGIELPA